MTSVGTLIFPISSQSICSNEDPTPPKHFQKVKVHPHISHSHLNPLHLMGKQFASYLTQEMGVITKNVDMPTSVHMQDVTSFIQQCHIKRKTRYLNG